MKLTFEEALQRAKDTGACSPALTELENLHSWEEFFAHEKAPYWSYWYARHVLKACWPEGEECIKQDVGHAYYYALDVIKGRFPEGEPTIKKDAWFAYRYALDVVRGRWPEGEESIKKSPRRAYLYARDVIKGRWPEVEESILRSEWAEEYRRKFLHIR